MFIQTDGCIFLRDHAAPLSEPLHADKAAAGIQINAAICIVPVWDERELDAKISEEIKSIQDIYILTHLVDFVNRQRVRPDRDRSCGGGSHR